MQSPALVNIIKMIEILPETTQDHLAEHLQQYIAELADEAEWDRLTAKTQSGLAKAAQEVRKAIQAGETTPCEI